MKKYVEKYLSDTLNVHLPKKTFKERHTFQKRADESYRIMLKYPNRLPIICEKWGNDPDMPEIDRKKYLVPSDLGVNQFLYIIRTRMKLLLKKVVYFCKWYSHAPHWWKYIRILLIDTKMKMDFYIFPTVEKILSVKNYI